MNNQMKNKILLLILAVFIINSVSAVQICGVYDNFSSGTLDEDKWEIRQDVEGQPFMDEYWVDSALENFHTQENIIGDKRVYLFPKHNFTTGDILEYDANLISKENNYMQMVLLTRDQYIRVGIFGYINGVQGYDELGASHIKIEFQENNFHLERKSPSNVTLIDNLLLINVNGTYELYVGSVSGNNGKVHIDYDNFKLCFEDNDDDKDGVGNSLDLCPNTPFGASVDSAGCSVLQFCNKFSPIKKSKSASWQRKCRIADWRDNENRTFPLDCRVQVRNQTCVTGLNPN